MILENTVTICGAIASPFYPCYTKDDIGYYRIYVDTPRYSGTVDTIPVIIRDNMIDVSKKLQGKIIYLKGELRSRNRIVDDRSRLDLFVFATEVRLVEEDTPAFENHILMDCHLNKPHTHRRTPAGYLVTDLFASVRKGYGASSYVPCIAWGKGAKDATSLNIGDPFRIYGRIQSREYTKVKEDLSSEQRITYEVSISRIEIRGVNVTDYTPVSEDNITKTYIPGFQFEPKTRELFSEKDFS